MFLCQCPERKPVLVDVFLPLWATIFSRRRVWVGKPAIELGFFSNSNPVWWHQTGASRAVAGATKGLREGEESSQEGSQALRSRQGRAQRCPSCQCPEFWEQVVLKNVGKVVPRASGEVAPRTSGQRYPEWCRLCHNVMNQWSHSTVGHQSDPV